VSNAVAVRCVSRSAVVERRSVVRMTAQKSQEPKWAVAAGAAVAPWLAASPALAEGTGEALGVDNVLLLIPLVVVPIALFTLYLQFGSTQNNEDFFGGYDDRRN